MSLRGFLLFFSCVGLSLSCGSPDDSCPDPSTNIVLGCPSYACEGQALGSESDTYESFAMPFFEDYCTRCHSTARDIQSGCSVSNPERCRNDAPLDRNWDDPASIRAHLPSMRELVGELNVMPVSAPFPTCEERRRIVSWIDQGAPGLP